jgi:hypothetical protein
LMMFTTSFSISPKIIFIWLSTVFGLVSCCIKPNVRMRNEFLIRHSPNVRSFVRYLSAKKCDSNKFQLINRVLRHFGIPDEFSHGCSRLLD